MAATADLVIRISGDIKNYDEALAKAQGETDALSGKITEIAKVAAVAFAALTAEIGLSIAAFKESQQVTNQLSQALKNNGIFSKQLVAAYQEQATALQGLTGISDETIVKSQTILQSFLGQQEVTQDLTQAVLDFSAAKQIDAETASNIFGKAIDGNTGVLKRYGIEIDENLTKQERLDQITQKIAQSFGGQAEAAGKGLGALNKLRESFGDLQEKIGERFAPIIEAISLRLTNFFTLIQENPSLVTLITTILAGGAAFTGLIVVLGGAVAGFIALTAAATAANIALAPILIPLAAIAAVVAGLAAAFAYFATKQEEVSSASEKTTDKLADLREELARLEAQQARGGGRLFGANTQREKEIASVRAQIATLEELQEKQQQRELQRETTKNQLLNEESRKAAERKAAEQNRIDNLTLARNRARQELLRLQESNASAELIAIKQQEVDTLGKLIEEKDKVVIKSLQERLETQKLLEKDAADNDSKARDAINDDILAKNQEYEDLSDEQKAVFKEKNEANLRSQYLTENQVRLQAANERGQIQIKEHNTFLANQQKFGTAYATINQIMNSAIVQGSAKAFSELAALQTSSNATLKSIGKVAAIADITIKTAQSAMNIYAGFSTIPIVGPALGIIGAAAAVAFGIENIGKVNAAAEGGLLTGGIPGVDSIPVLAQQGELITPKQNFDEVVDAVANQRAGVNPNAGDSQDMSIDLNVKFTPENFMDFIEIEQVKRRKLGTSRAG